MKLLDLTIKQIKTVERVMYQDMFEFDDCDLFEFINVSLKETLGTNPDIRLFDEGRFLKIDGELIYWFENELSKRALLND